MPDNSGGFFQDSIKSLSVTIVMLPGDARRSHLRLAGEMDISSSAVLAQAVDWLTTSAPASVLMDLAELTFACSTLPNFVARVHRAVPDGAELVLWRPGPATEWVLRLTDMASIATIRNEPTAPPTVLV